MHAFQTIYAAEQFLCLRLDMHWKRGHYDDRPHPGTPVIQADHCVGFRLSYVVGRALEIAKDVPDVHKILLSKVVAHDGFPVIGLPVKCYACPCSHLTGTPSQKVLSGRDVNASQ
jgi:hypothetical protein